MRRRPLVLITVTAVAVLVLSACAPAGPAEERQEAALPDGVTASLTQSRSDVAARGAQVRVANESGEDLRITRIVFDDDWFDALAVRERETLIAPGRTVDLRFALPASDCVDEPAADVRESRVLIEYETDDGAFVSVAGLDDPLAVVPELHARECLLHDVETAASLDFTAFAPSPSGLPAALELTVAPTGEAAASILEARKTNLLLFEVDGVRAERAPIGVDASASAGEPVIIVLPLVPGRCDPHAVQEDKRGTVFPIDVSVDGSSGVIELAVDEDMRAEILAWVGEWCQFGSSPG